MTSFGTGVFIIGLILFLVAMWLIVSKHKNISKQIKIVIAISSAIVLLLGIGITRQIIIRNTLFRLDIGFAKTFNDTINQTDRAMLEYSSVEVRFNSGKATEEEYINAIWLFEADLTAIKNEDKLKNPPAKYNDLVKEYEEGFDKILSAATRARESLGGLRKENSDEVLIKNKQDLEEGFKKIEEVKSKLGRLENTNEV